MRHMISTQLQVVTPKPAIVEELLSDINVVVSTCDAWCKWKVTNRVLSPLNGLVYLYFPNLSRCCILLTFGLTEGP